MLKIAEKRVNYQDSNKADEEKLDPIVIQIDKINNTKQGIEEYNCPDYIIGLIPRFF